MVGVPFSTPRTSTAGMVKPMVASTEPSEILTARCRRFRKAACNAPIASGASTSTATMTPTSACGALDHLHRMLDDVAELLGEIDRGHQRQHADTTV